MFTQFSPLHALQSVISNRKVVLSLLAAVSLTATISLSLRLVQSAPAGPTSPPVPLLAPPAQPSVVLQVPSEVLIGETMTFKVKFDNVGTAVGYGPFVDIVLDAGGANLGKITSTNPCSCDGIKFVSAQMVGVNGGPLALPASPPAGITTACANTPSTVSVAHPFVAVTNVTVPAGSQLVTLALPFGSFEPDQPEIEVEVTAKISNFADAEVPLRIYARGGFRYGLNPLDDPTGMPLDPPILSDDNTTTGTQVGIATQWTNQPTTPKVMILKKTYSGPENETATGPNFPRTYTLTVDIADGQTVNSVVLTDCLPNNMAYDQHLSISPATTLSVVEPLPPGVANNPNASCLVVTWPSLTGGPGPDGVVVFQFFIPKDDANGNLILAPNCSNVVSNNDISATGQWTPADPCDMTPVTVTSDVTPTDHVLTDKCIAIQKSVAMAQDTGAPGFTPGDILKYTLNFQISDFKTFGELEVVDQLSDGQSLLMTSAMPASLAVTDQFVPPTNGNFILNTDLFKTTSNDPAKQCGGVIGVTELTFKVSQKMMSLAAASNTRHLAGILTGGRATSNATAPAATGTIEFFVTIDDEFIFPHIGDKYVDKEDPINNCVVIDGKSLINVDPPALPNIVEGLGHDDSGTAISIIGDTLKKTVYAVQRGSQFICAPPAILSNGPVCLNSPFPPQEVRPGDDVTFRIEKTIPSTDAEQLTIEDWLPQPIFDINSTSTFAILPCPPTTVPLANNGCFHSDDTLHIPFPAKPTFTPLAGSNSIKFEYGDIFDPGNSATKIDLLFTSKVRNDPFADKLFLTNEVRECENNTFGARPCQVAIAQVNLREPNLRIFKGAIATNNPNGLFSQAVPGPTPNPTPAIATAQAPAGVTFGLTGFTGTISSTNLLGLMNSDLGNVDANDIVTFAITIENTGGHPAFDVKLDDIFPTSCFTVDLNTIHAQLGSGAAVSPIVTGNFSLEFPAPIDGLGTTPGDNIVVVTFQAQVKSDITPGCCRNNAKITQYASVSNGPDFVSAGFNPPYEDSAEVCTKPTLTKSVVATSEAHTAPETSLTGTPQVTIGEIVRYRLEVRLPEGSSPNLQITDAVPPGMRFLDGATARLAFVSNGAGITQTPSFGPPFNLVGNAPPPSGTLNSLPPFPSIAITGTTVCGVPVIFNLGNVQNNDNDPDLEYVVIEFNALVCNAPSNQEGTTLSNTFSVSVNNATIVSSPPINVIVREPNLTIAKAASPATAVQGVTVTYTITITNSSLVNAYEVPFADTLPSGLILDPGSVNFTGNCSSPVLVNTVPSLTCTQIPAGGVVTITYKALADPPTCPVTLTNNARVTWTSLPGPQGTIVNSTMSSTPGTSGAVDGERDGVTPPLTLNDYAASVSTPLTVRCPPCAKAPPDMVAWWPLDDPTGDTVVDDIAGAPDKGSPKPGPTIGPSSPASLAAVVGTGLNFLPSISPTGPNHHVEVPTSPELNFGTGDFAIDAWINLGQAGSIHPIVDKLDFSTPGTNKGYALFVQGGHLVLRIAPDAFGGLVAGVSTGPAITPGTWYHIAVTVRRNDLSNKPIVTFYINGVLSGSGTPAGPLMPGSISIDGTTPLWIGGNSRLASGGATISLGEIAIDELEFFKRELSQTEIQSIYSARSAGKCKCPTITLNPAAGALPAAPVNSPYSQTFTATGGCASSFTYSVTGGALPPGLTLSSNGVLSGTPTQQGDFTFTVTATDSCGCSKSQTYTLKVDCPVVPLALFNTGVANDRSLLASGATDGHYALILPNGNTTSAQVLASIPSSFVPNNATSSWIGPGPADVTTGAYTYRTTFTLTGCDPSSVVITGQWASDNQAVIRVNNVNTSFTTPNNGFGQFSQFTLNSSNATFHAGVNTVDFVVTNTESVTGLRVEMTGTVKCCGCVAPITLNPAPGALPATVVNTSYSQTFIATGGDCGSSFTYTVTSGTLPLGLTLSSNGVLSGTPKQQGDFTFIVTATNNCGCSQSQTYTLKVDCPMVPLALFNTGVADNGSLLASGATDAHYALTLPNGNSASAQALASIPSSYVPNNATSRWIGPGVGSQPAGQYTYVVTFNMPVGADLSTAIIVGQWASDNASAIFLNGQPTGSTTGSAAFGSFTPFVITGPFQQNANTLEFRVNNSESLTGLRVEMTGSVSCCPPRPELIISRFRENGPAGSRDEFVEIFNPSSSTHRVTSVNGSGYGVFASAGNGTVSNAVSLVCRIPEGFMIPARGYFLCTGAGYSLGNLGRNGGAAGRTAVGDALILIDIPNDAGLALYNVSALPNANSFVFDKVGFKPYGPSAPAPAYPSIAPSFCEGVCLQPVGDAGLTGACANPSGLFPVIAAGPACYGRSGQYEFLRRQTLFDPSVGTLHRDTGSNADDFILVSPNPSNNLGQAMTGISGISSVLGAAGPQGSAAPPDTPVSSLTRTPLDVGSQLGPRNAERIYAQGPSLVNPINIPQGTFTLRFRYTNNSGHNIAGLRFRVDNLSTLCGPQSAIPPTVGTGDARNLSSSPDCGTGNFVSVLKLLNSGPEVVVDSTGATRIVNGTVMEDLDLPMYSPGAPIIGPLSPLGGGVDNSIIVGRTDNGGIIGHMDQSGLVGDGVTGGSGNFSTTMATSGPTNVLRLRVTFGVVRPGRFIVLITPMAKFAPTP